MSTKLIGLHWIFFHSIKFYSNIYQSYNFPHISDKKNTIFACICSLKTAKEARDAADAGPAGAPAGPAGAPASRTGWAPWPAPPSPAWTDTAGSRSASPGRRAASRRTLSEPSCVCSVSPAGLRGAGRERASAFLQTNTVSSLLTQTQSWWIFSSIYGTIFPPRGRAFPCSPDVKKYWWCSDLCRGCGWAARIGVGIRGYPYSRTGIREAREAQKGDGITSLSGLGLCNKISSMKNDVDLCVLAAGG